MVVSLVALDSCPALWERYDWRRKALSIDGYHPTPLSDCREAEDWLSKAKKNLSTAFCVARSLPTLVSFKSKKYRVGQAQDRVLPVWTLMYCTAHDSPFRDEVAALFIDSLKRLCTSSRFSLRLQWSLGTPKKSLCLLRQEHLWTLTAPVRPADCHSCKSLLGKAVCVWDESKGVPEAHLRPRSAVGRGWGAATVFSSLHLQPLPTKLFSASYNCTLVDGSKLPVAFYSILCLAGTRKRLGRTCVTVQISMRIGWINHYHYEVISYHYYSVMWMLLAMCLASVTVTFIQHPMSYKKICLLSLFVFWT